MKIGNFEIFKKGFRAYYLLVISIVVLTITIQSMTQYSLNKQRSTALIVNLSGKQRMLSQKVLNELYSCRYHNCDYAEMKLALTKLYQMNRFLQEGNAALRLEPLEDETILKEFSRLEPHVEWLYSELKNFRDFEEVSFNDVRYRVDRFVTIMDGIVSLFQKKAEKDIKTMMIIELELAIFSIVILIFEIFFIVNPIISRIMDQKKKLSEIAWHQSHVFSSHMKNIADLQYVLKVEKDPVRQKEIYGFIAEELDELKKVSKRMVKSLEKTTSEAKPHHLVIRKVESFLEKYKLMPSNSELIDDGKVHSVKS
ncbi:type IV pili methyl-accepting chemotaxis transducer N-terminal domain-containing protein [Muricauda sp. 2012CJ35-5]|uniref:Type IV pili methyl-accepting chemotaxis transducer N-terminal domain-containing protein n=1 Tax=Flagellimonas spongiicola TaxID=2942208 RepID=A0ABT0PNT3_9FLAO|nr:type IV pili methyl-accepting chemotaxis transducer N-terminal domain-containing protein [Allomuricauda spongiicola]MCL6273033.1 type IV pili methyl-accepting chemotaxis transducer N-terminal domain-containing protein [Allomuricauda spongiicola]